MNKLTYIALALTVLIGCGAAFKVTPADRQAAYQKEAQTVQVLCKAYLFDRAMGLTLEAPAMTELCEGVK